jgi:hypothetical protein
MAAYSAQKPTRILVAAVVVASTCALSVAAAETPGLGQRVVAYCKQHKGKCVGNGASIVLAVAALQSAGAKPRGPDDPSRREPRSVGDFNRGERIFVLERRETSVLATSSNSPRPR